MPSSQKDLDKLFMNTRWLVLQKAHRHSAKSGTPALCKRDGFRFYFTALTGLLFTFPSRYWFTIGEIEYLALAGSPACFPQGYRFPRYLRKISRSIKPFSFTGLLPSLVALSRDIQLTKLYLSALPQKYSHRLGMLPTISSYNPKQITNYVFGLGFSLFARRY